MIKCDVKKCRAEQEIIVLGVGLCDKHYLSFCNGTDLDTRKGTLAHCSGTAVLLENGGVSHGGEERSGKEGD